MGWLCSVKQMVGTVVIKVLDSDDTYMDADYEDEGVVICDGHNDLEDEDDRNDIHLFWPRGGV